MRWAFWRRRQIDEALQAKRDAEKDRPEVERLTHELRAHGAENNFAPRIQQALRGH